MTVRVLLNPGGAAFTEAEHACIDAAVDGILDGMTQDVPWVCQASVLMSVLATWVSQRNAEPAATWAGMGPALEDAMARAIAIGHVEGSA